MKTSSYALILAGGSGTRFWPLSRQARPKQLISLFDDVSLLQRAIKRLEALIPAENILILTNPAQEKEVRAQAPQLPEANIIAEPCRRDTAPAVALGIGLVAARDPEASLVILPSDQLIENEAAFCALLQEALTCATQNNVLLTLGIKPTWPCPSYGYIERGEAAPALASHPQAPTCYKVAQFREKPNAQKAAEFLAAGNYSWNAGMFIWSVKSACQQLQKHAPELARFIEALKAKKADPCFIQEAFPLLTPISIDFALMEKADNVYNYEATFDWDDVGSWISVGKYLEQSPEGNQSNTELITQEAGQNIVFLKGAKKPVALLGVENLIIVDSGDALLIAHKDQADAIKHIVDKLPTELL